MPDFDYVAFAGLLGLAGNRLDRLQESPRCSDAALAAHRPLVIDMRPSHATFERTTKLFAALGKGDPDRDAVLKQLRPSSRSRFCLPF